METKLLLTQPKAQYQVLSQGDGEDASSQAIIEIASLWRRRFYISIAVAGTIMCILLLTILSMTRTRHEQPCTLGTSYTPASEAISYVHKWQLLDEYTPKLMGKPRQEMDDVWADLLPGGYLNFSSSELHLADGSVASEPAVFSNGGFAGAFGVWHTMHCLHSLNRFIHREYFYGGDSETWEALKLHNSHCIDRIRQYAMCQPDLSLYVLEWVGSNDKKPVFRAAQPHKCVDWNALSEWTNGRLGGGVDSLVRPDASFFNTTQGLDAGGN